MWLSAAEDMCTPSAEVKHNLQRILERRERYYHDHTSSLSPLEATPGAMLSYEEGSNTSLMLQDSSLFARDSSCSCTPHPHRAAVDADVGPFTTSALPTFMQTPSHNPPLTLLQSHAPTPNATHCEPRTPRAASPQWRQIGVTHSARTSPRTMPVPLRQRDVNTPSPCPPRCPPGQTQPRPQSNQADEHVVRKGEVDTKVDIHALDTLYQRQVAQLQQMVQKVDRERAAAVVKAQHLLDAVEELRLQSLVKDKEGESLRSTLLHCTDEVQRLQYEYDWLCRLYQHDQRYHQTAQQSAILREEELARRVHEVNEARWHLSLQLRWCQTQLLAPQPGIPLIMSPHVASNARLHDMPPSPSRTASGTAALPLFTPPSITRLGGGTRCYTLDEDSSCQPAALACNLPVVPHYDKGDNDTVLRHTGTLHQSMSTALEAARMRSSPRWTESQRATSTPMRGAEVNCHDAGNSSAVTTGHHSQRLQEERDVLARELAEERALTAEMQNEIDDLMRSELSTQEQLRRCELQAECDAAECGMVWNFVRWQNDVLRRGGTLWREDTPQAPADRAVVSGDADDVDGCHRGVAPSDPRRMSSGPMMESEVGCSGGAAQLHMTNRPSLTYEEMLGAVGTVVEQVVRAQLLPLKLSTESTRALLEDGGRGGTCAVIPSSTTPDPSPRPSNGGSLSLGTAADGALSGWPSSVLASTREVLDHQLRELHCALREGLGQILATQGTLQDTLAAVHGVARRAARVATHNQKVLDARLVDILACQSSLARQSVLTAASMSCSSLSAPPHRLSSRWTSCETTRTNDSAVIDVSALTLGAAADDGASAAAASTAARLPDNRVAQAALLDQSSDDAARRGLLRSADVHVLQKFTARNTHVTPATDTARPLPLPDERTTLSSSGAWRDLLDEVSERTQMVAQTPYSLAASKNIE